MTVNNAEYTVIKLLGKGEGGYSYLMTDGAYTGKDGGNMKIPWESRLLYAVLALECKRSFAYIPDNPDLYDYMTGIKYLNFIADMEKQQIIGTMKHYKKTMTKLLTAAVLLITVSMTGCTKLSETPNSTPSEVDAPAEPDGFGVYIKLERNDASSIALHGSNFTKVCENADGSLLKAGEWIFTGDDIVQLSKKDNCSVLFTVSARDADDTLLGEGTFLYDVAQEKLYVTISEDGVTCSTSDAAEAPADVPPVLTLPILDEIDRNVTIGTSGSSLLAVQEAAKLLDWGVNTGLGADEISDATSTWLASKNDNLTECLKKLELVDDAYKKLLTDEARELLDSVGCENVEITWGSDPVEPVEAIMQAAGFRGCNQNSSTMEFTEDKDTLSDENSTVDDAWKVEFEKSLMENYGVTPDHYEDLGNGVYQVYVEIDGKLVPYVAVDSATGDYHG